MSGPIFIRRLVYRFSNSMAILLRRPVYKFSNSMAILLRRPVLDTGSRAVFTGHNFRHSEFSSESMYLWQVRYL